MTGASCAFRGLPTSRSTGAGAALSALRCPGDAVAPHKACERRSTRGRRLMTDDDDASRWGWSQRTGCRRQHMHPRSVRCRGTALAPTVLASLPEPASIAGRTLSQRLLTCVVERRLGSWTAVEGPAEAWPGMLRNGRLSPPLTDPQRGRHKRAWRQQRSAGCLVR